MVIFCALVVSLSGRMSGKQQMRKRRRRTDRQLHPQASQPQLHLLHRRPSPWRAFERLSTTDMSGDG